MEQPRDVRRPTWRQRPHREPRDDSLSGAPRVDQEASSRSVFPRAGERGPSTAEREERGGVRSSQLAGRAPTTRRYAQISDRSRCRFCREKVVRVDYKDILTLQRLCTSQGRIFSRKRSGNCAAHHRQIKRAVKQARYIGLLSYTV